MRSACGPRGTCQRALGFAMKASAGCDRSRFGGHTLQCLCECRQASHDPGAMCACDHALQIATHDEDLEPTMEHSTLSAGQNDPCLLAAEARWLELAHASTRRTKLRSVDTSATRCRASACASLTRSMCSTSAATCAGPRLQPKLNIASDEGSSNGLLCNSTTSACNSS